ncbi:MAG TPA: tol-pal system protein YbgF [Nitrospiria bacterium]|jgi:tol-pal system protein YbgF|nr:tol-pal system protein YbgF [Nitrospiria bacterium]
MRTKSSIPILLVLGFLSVSMGCALHADLVDTQLDLDNIKQQQAQIQKRLETIENYFKERAGSVQRGQADIVIKVDQLGVDFQVLEGKLEELNRLIAQLSVRLDDQTFRIAQSGSRLDALETRASGAPQAINPPRGQAPEGGEPTSETTSPDRKTMIPGRTPGQSVSILPTEAYNLAYNDYIKGNYDLALIGFQNYISQFPDTSLSPDAQYWIGQVYYTRKDYRKAIEAFALVVQKYSKSDAVARSLLQEGLAYLELGDKTQARAAFRRVVQDYPFSEESKLAKNRLAEMR